MATGKGATMHQHNDYKVQQEFERVNKSTSKVSETISFQQGSGGRGGNSTNVTNNTNIVNEPTLWALTIQKNSVTQIAPNDKKKIQVVNFQDNAYSGKTFDCYITWEMTKESPSPDFLTIPDGLRISIQAKGKISVVEMLNELKAVITQVISGTMSIVNDHSTEYPKLLLKLKNDEDDPGENKYYGTDGYGDKGWQDNTNISDGHSHTNKTDLDNYDPDDFALVGHNHNLNDLTEKSYNSLTDKPTIPTSFTDLSDVPQSYTDQAGKMLVVNDDEDALEFTDVSISNIFNFHTQADLVCDFASHNYIIATIDEDLSITVANVTTGIIYGIMIKNDDASDITVTLPDTDDVKASDTTVISAGKYKELSFFSDGTTRYWQISEELS